jgi:imidazolonepropionase-like amidohydrolase
VASCEEAVEAIAGLREVRAAVVKVTLNAEAGPVLPDDVLRTIVTTAHEHGLRVVAHVEGRGQPQRAARAGVDCFAHAPWTPLSDDELRAMVGRVDIISTLDMHGRGRYRKDFETALDNLRRFAAPGGTVIYGTDLGNAITTTDLNLREVDALRAAGLRGARLLRALGGTPLLPTWSRTATLLPGRVASADDAVASLHSSLPVDAAALKELLS